MGKKQALPLQTVTATAIGFRTLVGEIIDHTTSAVTIKVKRPRVSGKFDITTVPVDANLVAVYGTPGNEGQVVIKSLADLYSATGQVEVADGVITVTTEGDEPTYFYPGPNVDVSIVGLVEEAKAPAAPAAAE